MIYDFLYYVFILSEAFFEDPDIGMRISFSGIKSLLGVYLGCIVGIFAIYYLLRSFGLYKMAKKRGFSNPALCFVPFYALFIISKLRSDCNALKKHSFYPIVAVSAIGLYVLCSAVLDIAFSLKIFIMLAEAAKNNPSEAYLTGEMFLSYQGLTDAMSQIMSLLKLVYLVFIAMLYCDLFRTYAPFKSKTHTTLSVIFAVITGSSLLYGAFTLALSGKTAINYDEILEKRRIYFGYGGNPYSGNGYNGNNNNNNNNGQNDNFDRNDPFSDFSGKNNSADSDNPFGEFSDTHGNSSSDEPFSDFGSESGNAKKGDNSDDGDSLF